MKSKYLAILACMIVAAFANATITIEIPTEIAPSFTLRLSVKGKAVEADIYLIPADPVASSHLPKVKHLRSNKSGVLELKNLPEGDYILASNTEPPYGWHEYVRVEVGSDRKSIDVNVPILRPPPEALPISKVHGRIIDEAGAAIPGASVVVERLDDFGTPVAASTSGPDGVFNLKVETGTYKMKVAAPGFKLIIVPIRVETDAILPRSLRVLLKVTQTDELVVDPYNFDVTPEQ